MMVKSARAERLTVLTYWRCCEVISVSGDVRGYEHDTNHPAGALDGHGAEFVPRNPALGAGPGVLIGDGLPGLEDPIDILLHPVASFSRHIVRNLFPDCLFPRHTRNRAVDTENRAVAVYNHDDIGGVLNQRTPLLLGPLRFLLDKHAIGDVADDRHESRLPPERNDDSGALQMFHLPVLVTHFKLAALRLSGSRLNLLVGLGQGLTILGKEQLDELLADQIFRSVTEYVGYRRIDEDDHVTLHDDDDVLFRLGQSQEALLQFLNLLAQFFLDATHSFPDTPYIPGYRQIASIIVTPSPEKIKGNAIAHPGAL
jgi:hypothetical protein